MFIVLLESSLNTTLLNAILLYSSKFISKSNPHPGAIVALVAKLFNVFEIKINSKSKLLLSPSLTESIFVAP